MRQFAIASFIEPPTAGDFLFVDDSFGVISSQFRSRRFQFINLAAGACLVPIDASGIQKQRSGNLLALGIQHDRRDQTLDASVKSDYPRNLLPFGKRCFLDLHDHIQYGAARAIWLDQFAQGGSHRDAFLEPLEDTGRKGDGDGLFAPLPAALLIGEAAPWSLSKESR